jgi:L-glutamine-phosphate cytidylyltransferase
MKIVILAAGKGSRLGKLTSNTPKVLMDLGNGHTLLETNLENMFDSGVIDKVVVISGYGHEQVEAKLKKHIKEKKEIEIIYNPFYELTNNLMTLWVARHKLDEDFIITNGDNIFEKEVYSELVKNTGEGIYLTISKHKGKNFYDGDMKVILREEMVEKVSKKIPMEEANCESVGLALVRGEKYLKIFNEALEELGKRKENLNSFWLEIFNLLSERGGMVKTFEIDGEKLWREIDFHGDLRELLSLLKEKKDLQNSTISKKNTLPSEEGRKIDDSLSNIEEKFLK